MPRRSRCRWVTDDRGPIHIAEPGRNDITIEVTAEDGTTKKLYTITVTRKLMTTGPDDASLADADPDGHDEIRNRYGSHTNVCSKPVVQPPDHDLHRGGTLRYDRGHGCGDAEHIWWRLLDTDWYRC